MKHTEAPASPDGRRFRPDTLSGRLGAVARQLRGRGGVETAPPPQSTPPNRSGNSTVHVLTDVVRGREAFLRLKKEWDAAVESGPDPSPALRHDLLRIWLENFAASREPLVFIARRKNRIAAALGITLERRAISGIPMTVAEGWTNAHSTRGGPILGEEGIDAIPGLVRRLHEEQWDVLHIRDVPQEGGILPALTQSLQDRGCLLGFDSPMESPYIPLPGSWDELYQRLDGHFRQNLRRRRRRLAEHGELGFEVITGGDEVDAALEDALAIEASGWKGAGGTAIRSRPELVGFYSAWVRLLAREKRLRLCFLTVGGRRVAFHFGHVSHRRYWLPKCGFDEAFRECSPGQLLMEDVLKRCIREKIEAFEFLGHSMQWKRDWTPLVHPHASLWAFRPGPRGTTAHAIRFRIRPRISQILTSTQEGALRARSEVERAIAVAPSMTQLPKMTRLPAVARLSSWIRKAKGGSR